MKRGYLKTLAVLLMVFLAPRALQADDAAEYKALKEDVEEYLKRQAAAVNQNLTATRELTERQQGDISAMLKAIRTMQAQVAATEAKMTVVMKENDKLKTEVARLAEAIETERAARKAADRKIVAEVAKAVSEAVVAPAPDNVANAAVDGRRYRVARGDTLGAIAKAFGTTVGVIKRANDLESDLIRPGQELIIPEE